MSDIVADPSPADPKAADPTAAGSAAATARRAQIAERLTAVHERLDAACAAVGRDPAGVTLIAVTKTYPAADVEALAGLGVLDVAENRGQELQRKHAEVPSAARLRWHFVGQVQTNKAALVVAHADVVHSVDRNSLVTALDKAATARGRVLDCLVQVCLDDRPGRGGAPPSDVLDLADRIAGAPGLRLGGLMAVAPLGGDARAAFAQLAALSDRVRRDHPDAVAISAGMSGDLEAAVAERTTHVRVGTSLLGVRA